MPPSLRLLFSFGALFAVATASVCAFDLQTDESGVYTIKWYQSPVALDIRLPNTAALSDGRTAAASVRDAATTWNSQLETLRFTPTIGAVTPRVAGNGRNELVIESTINGSAFGTGVLAVTLIHHNGNEVGETDIIFNAGEVWDSYTGSLHSRPDLHRVALHELGHVLGLEHPDEAGQFVTAIMNSRMSDIDALRHDDISGAQALYGAPSFVPANDAFAQALELTGVLSPFISDTTNVNASREPGEPTHAGVTSGHSLWWHWTSGTTQPVVLDTDGSNFDTVLAVYTGSSLSMLTEVASNDDEETPEQNPNPDRKRSSKVSFTAQAGTTYRIAVDGWGDAERFPAGSTGLVKLRLFFETPDVAPTILMQPRSQKVDAGITAYFTTMVDGRPAPTLQWQRRAVGSSSWIDLVNNQTYSGATDVSLGVRARYTLDGDAFRCVATNDAGQAATTTVTLTVIPGPLPEITAHPVDSTVNDGDTLLLSVAANLAETYRWYHNGEPIAGAFEASLILDAPTPDDAGTYHVVAINASGATTSSAITVIVNTPPAITNLGPRVRYLSDEAPTAFEVTARGQGTLSYQWMHDGRPIPGATAASFQPPTADRRASGAYWARVTDINGTRHGHPFFLLIGPRYTRIHRWGHLGNPLEPVLSVTDAITGECGLYSAIVVRRDGRVTRTAWTNKFDPPFPDDAIAIAADYSGYNCVILRANGTIAGFGQVKNVPRGLDHVVAVAVAGDTGVALRNDGTVVVWDDSENLEHFPVPTGLDDVVAIDADENQIVAVRADGRVVSWRKFVGISGAIPVPVDLTDVTAVACGALHSLALRANGEVVAWGETDPVPTAARSGVVAIAAGTRHSVALKSDGSIVAWGVNDDSQSHVPAGMGPAFAIAANGNQSMAFVEAAPDPAGRIINLSVRSFAGDGDQTLVMGFVVAGRTAQSTLLRGIGPALTTFGVNGAIQSATLTVYDPDSNSIASNVTWDHMNSRLIEVSQSLGAFPLPESSQDSVLLIDLPPGSYSAHVRRNWGNNGIALVEAYDATQLDGANFSNVSARTYSGTGDGVLVAGFVLAGEQTRTLLIRGIGPTLEEFGLAPAELLANPVLRVFRDTEVIASNDNWAGDAELVATFEQLGAFPLPDPASRDAALLITLDPGAYTVQVSGADGGTGIALVEIYALP